jgi:hypothetical protein
MLDEQVGYVIGSLPHTRVLANRHCYGSIALLELLKWPLLFITQDEVDLVDGILGQHRSLVEEVNISVVNLGEFAF